ncbi:BMP family ABC transporter substrate-binding protein [Leptolyngbya sp. UWPOB_LEPTO1]|uniref:BMP family ABC transporter substrate-binding protein n=1 Tax=Leptolyngbya sp. UWPOB_LEPTO1 TaxID=2815653 RepID=UPI00257BB542|nr:BMP family ABC transporter substrate-binding protein [Leptolyngbya sp. UWPOB_LEPTO1]
MSNRSYRIMNRRTVIRGLLAAGAFGASSRLWIGCTPTSNTATNPNPTPNSTPLEIGFIYVGPKDDYGYNQSHAEGKATVDKLSGVKIVEEASVPETTAAEETMTNMIKQDGATVLFPTSYGYFNPHSLKIAREFPEVQLFHPNQPYKDEYPKNVGSYFSDLVEPAYLAGIVAALTSKTGKLGFIIPKPIPVVLREANSFALGAQSVKPNIVVQAIVTGDWSLPVKEAEAANSLLDQGSDVLTGRVDNMKVIITTAEKRGAFSSGYHINQASLAPKGYLTGVEWNWGKIYSTYVEMVKAGKTLMNGGIPHVVAGGLKEDFCKLSPFGASVSAETKKAVEAAKAKLLDGSLAIFKGELKDNKGNVVIPEMDP